MKRLWIVLLAATMLATIAVPAWAIDGGRVRAMTQTRSGEADPEDSVQARAQVQTRECDCDAECMQTCDGSQEQTQLKQETSEGEPEGHMYAGAKAPGSAGHHRSHKYERSFGTVE
jgi:hypothetical protein